MARLVVASTLLLLLARAALAAPAIVATTGGLEWDGRYADPDGLRIDVRREGDVVTARSEAWLNRGAVHGGSVSMDGLRGTLSAEAITWSNGSVWRRARLVQKRDSCSALTSCLLGQSLIAPSSCSLRCLMRASMPAWRVSFCTAQACLSGCFRQHLDPPRLAFWQAVLNGTSIGAKHGADAETILLGLNSDLFLADVGKLLEQSYLHNASDASSRPPSAANGDPQQTGGSRAVISLQGTNSVMPWLQRADGGAAAPCGAVGRPTCPAPGARLLPAQQLQGAVLLQMGDERRPVAAADEWLLHEHTGPSAYFVSNPAQLHPRVRRRRAATHGTHRPP